NYTGNVGLVSGSDPALQSAETLFQQDLNGDGHLGSAATLIERIGATSLAQAGNNYFLYGTGTSSGPELYYQGAPVAAGQFGAWAPLGAEKTASGYEVAWKVAGADQYTIWNTDNNGNYTGNAGILSG